MYIIDGGILFRLFYSTPLETLIEKSFSDSTHFCQNWRVFSSDKNEQKFSSNNLGSPVGSKGLKFKRG